MPEGEAAPAEESRNSSNTENDEQKDRIYEQGKHKKILRFLTVMAYLSTVSGTAFMLSLYYLFLWTPKVQLGGKALVADPPPPGTLSLFFPEMAPQFAARVASEEEAMRRKEGPGSREPLSPQKRTGSRDIGESQVPATPKLTLPVMEEEGSGKKREARSTAMETTQQTITIAPTSGGVNRAHLQTQPLHTSTSPPLPPTHRTNPKPGEHPRHTTPHPHPMEIGVHA